MIFSCGCVIGRGICGLNYVSNASGLSVSRSSGNVGSACYRRLVLDQN